LFSNRRRRRILPALAVASVIAGILLVTLDRFELPPPGVQLWEWCFMCGRQWGIDFVLNIALFIPLGLVLRLALVPPFQALLGIAATTFVIEVLQLVIPGRITSIDDLISNTIGGIVGYALAGHLRTIAAPSGRQTVAAVLTAGTAVLTALWGTLWLFAPAPTSHPYWGQFSPELGQFGRFEGTILEASVGDEPLRNGRLPNTDAVRELLRRDSVTVHALVRGGRNSHRLAPVVSIFDGEHNEVMLVGRSGGRSLTFRLRSRASRIGLRTPEVSTWNAFPPAANGGDTNAVRLRGTVNGYAISASAKVDTGWVSRTIHFRPTHGWAYLVPFENLFTKRAPDFTTIWMAILFAPLGYYAAITILRRRRAVERIATVLWVATVGFLALVALPWAVGLSTGDAAEWRGAAFGVASGALLAAAVIVVARSRDRLPGRYN
jgi:glycopeptide antibiotics resistance protein